MKVYIVTAGEYSEYHIEAVFTDKKQAEMYAALHHCDEVEEWESDSIKAEGEVKVWIVHEFGVWNKCLSYVGSRYYNRKFTDIRRSISGLSIYVSLEEWDHDKAEKIAQAMYAEYLYERSENGT